MGKQKYNWAEIKLEYMTSKIIEVKSFMQLKFGGDKVVGNGNFELHTKGWRHEKEEFLNQIKKEVLDEYKKDLKEEYKPSVKELSDMLKGTLGLTSLAIKYEIDGCTVTDKDGNVKITRLPNMGAVERAYKIAKNELSDAKVEIKDDYDLSEDDQKLLDEVLNDNL